MFNDKYNLTQAVLEGRKAQTRRIVKTSDAFERVNPDFDWDEEDIKNWEDDFVLRVKNMSETERKECFNYLLNHPKYKVGEIVAVAQSYNTLFEEQYDDTLEMLDLCKSAGWSNKMFVRADLMPHQIRIIDVRVERLQDISDEDCFKEGIIKKWHAPAMRYYYYIPNVEVKSAKDVYNTPLEAYAVLIDKVSGKGTWGSNPYVWVYDFELIK